MGEKKSATLYAGSSVWKNAKYCIKMLNATAYYTRLFVIS